MCIFNGCDVNFCDVEGFVVGLHRQCVGCHKVECFGLIQFVERGLSGAKVVVCPGFEWSYFTGGFCAGRCACISVQVIVWGIVDLLVMWYFSYWGMISIA